MEREWKNGLDEAEAAKQAREDAARMDEATVGEMVGREEEVKGFFRHVKALKKYWRDACDVFSLLKDWVCGRYKATPWAVVASLAGALLYVLSPLDLVPDFLPLVGYLDDAAVFAAALSFSRSDLERYRAWKREQERTIDAEWRELDDPR